MFSRACTAFVSVLLLFVVATAAQSPTTISVPSLPASTPAGDCSPGPIQCCNTVQAANAGGLLGLILGLLNVIVNPVTAQVAGTCSPISLVGLQNGGCNTNAVCCTNNNVGNVGISVGCIPVTL